MNPPQKRSPSRASLRALDALNLVLADVRDGLGPYLAIYLATKHWDSSRIGLAMATMGVATVVAQTPAGALIDRTSRKRSWMVAAAALVAAGSVAMARFPTFPVILGAQATIGVASAIFAPAIAAVSLGLVGHARFAGRTGRNEAFNHAGNVIAAVLAGWIGDHVAYEGIFYLLAGMCAASIVAALMIRPGEIDDDLARGGASPRESDAGQAPPAARLGDLFRDRRIGVFTASVVLFHFANAAMLPLVGQKMTAGMTKGVAGSMSACIIAAQVVMVPVALLAGRLAVSWGRRPTFLVGFAALPIRGLLYTLTDDPRLLVAVQLLDGIGAGIFGVVGVLFISDLTEGTGRFNLMQGTLATATGLGSAASLYLTGAIVSRAGFNAGFLALSAIAAVALAFHALAMPEARPSPERPGAGRSAATRCCQGRAIGACWEGPRAAPRRGAGRPGVTYADRAVGRGDRPGRPGRGRRGGAAGDPRRRPRGQRDDADPGHDAELAAGFLLTEGIIRRPEDVVAIRHCPRARDRNAIDALLRRDVAVDFRQLTRHVFASSSCGLCGKATIQAIHGHFPPVRSEIVVDARVLTAMPDTMRASQATFDRTGGLHAAALFDPSGRMVVIREDVGRHNAVDKVVGHCLLAGIFPLEGHVLVVSGRSSFEIMQKALAARVPMVAAVSAPSSLAVEFAEDSGQTLIGFLREGRMNVYAHPGRVAFGPREPAALAGQPAPRP